jgi:hypothetical protein
MKKQAMAFYHEDGLVAAWKFATTYIGEKGHIATLPEIIDARLASKPGDFPWATYFTTSSAEYLGRDRDGRLVLVIAHGVGPMATLDGIQKAYSHEYKDKSRCSRGGRITVEEFQALVDAADDDKIFVVDYETYYQRYEHPFCEYLRASQVMDDPVLLARFGGLERLENFTLLHMEFASQWLQEKVSEVPDNRHGLDEGTHQAYLSRREQAMQDDVIDPFLLQCGDASNCGYQWHFREGEVIAHLLSTGGLMNVHHEAHESMAFDVICHEWWNGVRFVGVPNGAVAHPIDKGPGSADQLIKKQWRQLLQPVKPVNKVGLRRLMKIKDTHFTMYPKKGARVDTYEPEFVVTKMEPVGDPVEFQTIIGGHEAFFRYDITELKALAPRGANGYTLIDAVEIVWGGGNPMWHKTRVQFYRTTVDSSKRVERAANLAKDFERMLKLVG